MPSHGHPGAPWCDESGHKQLKENFMLTQNIVKISSLLAVATLSAAASGCAGKAAQRPTATMASADGTSVGLTQFIKGTIELTAGTITVPLYQGALKDGRTVWYLITDASDRAEAERLGVEYAPSLAKAANTAGVRQATVTADGTFMFDKGTVDFSPARSLTPGAAPQPFPPTAFQPGSVGDADYSPFVQVTTAAGTVVYSAPTLAFNVSADELPACGAAPDYSKIHDKVVSLCAEKHEVTVGLSHGFADGTALVYFSFDANDPMAATMEASTYAPAIDNLKNAQVSLPIYAVANGQVGKDNPERQGFDSALSGDGSPLNVLDGSPSLISGYSPLWDLQLGEWTDAAIKADKDLRLTSVEDFTSAAEANLLTGPGGGPLASTGILINCPVVALTP